MSKPPLKKVWGLWKQSALLVEQAIGYILQHMLDHRHDIRSIRRDVDRLIVHTKLPPEDK